MTHLRIGLALAFLLAAGHVYAYESTLQAAATLHRSHLAYMADTERSRAVLLHALSRPSLLLKTDKIVLARAAAAYGLLADAEHYYKIADPGHDARYTEAWLRLARGWYKRKRYKRALQAIQRVAGFMTKEVARTAGPLQARILLALNKPAEAVDVLRKSLRRYDQPPIVRFNLGVALIRSGHRKTGVGALNKIGTLDAGNARLKALRDKANLLLAYAYLDAGQGATARALFDRVRLDGPYSKRALLGLGWAELAPDGQQQTMVVLHRIPCRTNVARLVAATLPVLGRHSEERCTKPEVFRDPEDLPMRANAQTQAQRYRRALVAWTELAKRSGSDAAIQEALVAQAYAYRELGDLDKASAAFEHAIKRLGNARDKIDAVLDQLAHAPSPRNWQFNGRLGPEWVAQRWDFPAGDHGAYLMRVVTDNSFRLTAQTLRELYALEQKLGAASATAPVLLDKVDGFIDSIANHGGTVPDALYAQKKKLTDLLARLDKLQQRVDKQQALHDQRLRILTREGVVAYRRKLDNYIQHARRGRAGLYHATEGQGGTLP